MNLRDRIEIFTPDQVLPDVNDERGNDTDTDPGGDSTPSIEPAQIRSVSAEELIVGRDQTISRWSMLLLARTSATSKSRVRWPVQTGHFYEVDGDVLSHPDARGRVHHHTAFLRRVE